MDRLLKEMLESLLQESGNSKRLGKRIINLAGFLRSAEVPEPIRSQLNSLSRLLIQQDAFDALLEPVNLMARAGLTQVANPEIAVPLLSSLEAVRKEISALDEINYAELIAWLVEQAQQRKLIRVKGLG